MKEEDVLKFVSEAVDYVESNSPKEELGKRRVKLAKWLHSRYNISLKEVKLNMQDGKPYLIVEYLNESSEPIEASLNISKWESNLQ